jgi:phosphomannomutase
VYGFEEAIGYLVNPGTVRDKDGISAAVAFLDLASGLAAEGVTIAGRLRLLAERFGYFASGQVSIRVTELEHIAQMMARVRAQPPTELAGVAVARIDDYSEGFEGLPPTDLLAVHLVDGSRAMIRPSGTEPKLKIYLDVSSDTGTYAERRDDAEGRLRSLEGAARALVTGTD